MNLPNKITVFRFCCIPFLWLFSLWQFRYHWVATLLVYFIACVSDTVDGNIARKEKLVTNKYGIIATAEHMTALRIPVSRYTQKRTVWLLYRCVFSHHYSISNAPASLCGCCR